MLHEFPAPFIGWYPVENHTQIKDELLPKIYSHATKKQDCFKRQCTGLNSAPTTTFYHQSFDYFTDDILNSIVWKPLNELFKEKQLQPTPIQSDVTGLWWNIYERGDSAAIHRHLSADFTGIYLLHNEEPNKTVFYNPGQPAPNYPHLIESYTTEHITEGHVILFPSYLLHYVLPCEKHRVIVSFNVATFSVLL